MADKSFGVKELNIIGTGTPTIQSPNSGDLNITAATSTFSGHVALGDSKVLKLGAAPDMSIFHDGTSGSINLANGSLTTRVHDAVGKGFFIEDPNGGSAETIAKFEKDATSGKGRCELMYEGLKKFETTSSGVTITGDLTVSGTYPGSGSGGETVQDEGSSLSTTGTTLNFVGDGVVASGTGATKTITISGGGGGGSPTTVLVSESSDDNAGYNIPFLTATGAGGGQRGLQVDNGGLGFNAGTSVSTGDSNTLIGAQAADTLTTGTKNTAVGVAALQAITSVSSMTAVGYRALYNNTTGTHNTAVGVDAGYNVTTGAFNTFFGNYSGEVMAIGSHNTLLGYYAGGRSNNDHNTCIGSHAGQYLQGQDAADARRNTIVGAYAGDSITFGANNTILGYNAEPSSSTADNQVVFGDGSVSQIRCAVTSITSSSDRRDKTDIIDIPDGLQFLNKLRPVKFKWQNREPDG